MIDRNPSALSDPQSLFVGLDRETPLLDGSRVRYVSLDNAATTPPFASVVETIERFLPYYSSVHRGTGFKSRLSTVAYDQAHDIIARFVGADPASNTVIFGKNTTEAINKLSHRLELGRDAVVLTTQMEHHSNDLPWRSRAKVVHVKVTPEGRLDEDDLDRVLAQHGDRVALLTVTAASNVSGFVQPIHDLARKAHAVGAKILVDSAQYVAHRKIDMKADDDPEHLDFVALSAHKMYAPFGTGALIGPKRTFLEGGPEYSGGGTVDVVTLDEVHWAGLPDREEAGSPNIVGAIAMAAAAQTLTNIGMERVADHEDKLVSYTLERLRDVPGITVYGQSDPARSREKVGVIPFNLEGMSHFLVAAILGYEGGIGVRSGCFCAHPYVVSLLRLPDSDLFAWRDQAVQGIKANLPGMVRASFGCYNTTSDVDRLIDMLLRIKAGDFVGQYEIDESSGEYAPRDYLDPLADFFLLDPGRPFGEILHGACGR